MLIGGLEKLTLVDYPGKVACTVFTLGCNFRCGFCHNPELVNLGAKLPSAKEGSLAPKSRLISEKSFFDFLKKQKNYLDGVCITGGEPTLHKDLPDFIKKIKKSGFFVKLDTNGSNPVMLKNLINKKMIDYVAMDIKTSAENYNKVSNCGIDVEKIKTSVELIKNSTIDYEFRTTILPGVHTKEDIIEIGKWLKGAEKYYLQQFRKGKTLDKDLSGSEPFTDKEMKNFCRLIKANFYICEARLN